MRPAGTVGGDEGTLRHVLPAVLPPPDTGPGPAGRPLAPPLGGRLADDDPATAARSADDTDEGWSQPADDPDGRLRAERPPHWSWHDES